MSKIALLPGGFKPPHAGHYNMAKWLATNTDADIILVRVGSKERDGITREMSLALWNLYIQEGDNIIVKASTSNSPVRDVYDYVEQEAPEGSTVYLGLGAKDETDQRFANIGKFAEPRNIKFETILVPPQAGGVSGTQMREFIKSNDKKSFEKYIPNHVDKDQAWNIVTNMKEDLYNPEDKVLDYMKSSVPGPKKPVEPAYKYKRPNKPFRSMYETRGGESEMHIYDFDETIARAETPIPYEVKSPDGNIIEKGETTSVEFEKKKEYLENEYDEGVIIDYNFDAFKKPIIDATINNPVFQKLLNSIKNPNAKVTILTARSVGFPITQFLKDQGIWAYVVPLGLEVDGAVTGQDKANWIEKRIKDTTKKIYFIDDADENKEAVSMLSQKYPNIEFDIQDPPSMDEMMIGMMSPAEKKKHAKKMKTLSKDLKKINKGDQYVKVPKSAKGSLTRKLSEEKNCGCGQNPCITFGEGRDPKKGTGKKPKGSGRRLYTDENPKDTVKVKFSTRQDIVDTLTKKSFKSKPHKRQSQIINLIHQRVRAALSRTKDPEKKKRLKSAFEYIKKRKEASKRKTQRMKKENVFTKNWWKEILKEILTEGGAAGHMAHPFNLPNVNNGKDLLDIFKKSAESLNKNPGAIKIDGVNASIRLVDIEGKKQFVMDRGSKQALDIKGITKSDLEDRFKTKDGTPHGMIKTGGEVLDMFNEALPSIKSDLEKLGAYDDPNILFNMEYVSGKTNVQDYNTNFIAIHGLNKIGIVDEPSEKTGKMLSRRKSKEISYDKSALQSLLDNLKPIAKKRGYEVYGSVPTTMKKKPNFSSALSKNYTVNAGESSETKSLGRWLNDLSDIPEKDLIGMNVGYKAGSSTINNKKVGAVSKQVYLAILNGENIDGLFDDAEDRKKAIQGFVTYLATEKLGDEVLKVLDSPMGSADKHEGVVIRDKNISDVPFKITGKFILGGMQTGFR